MCLDCGSSLRLPQVSRLLPRMLFEDFAPRAEEADFVTAVCWDLDEAVAEWAARLAGGATRSFAESKALLNPPAVVRETLAREAAAIKRLAATADGRSGIAAFLAREEPVFGGN